MSLGASVIQRRETLADALNTLETRYWNDEPIEDLVAGLTQTFDTLLEEIWRQHFPDPRGCALYAVGGYGRSELHPGSDIDILVLADKPEKHRAAIEDFLRDVFDLNVEVGHSVRDTKSCVKECRADITVATALFERRFLTGDRSLIPTLDKALAHRKIWPVADFFIAKRDEQVARHRHYDNVDYNLEPNVKTSPGGMRDIHTTLWICKRQFGTTDIDQLVALEVLTDTEAR